MEVDKEELKKFVTSFFSGLQCELSVRDGKMEIRKVPAEFEEYYGKKSPYILVFDRPERIHQQHDIIKSDFINTYARYLLNNRKEKAFNLLSRFIFENIEERAFWMKNTLIPLDIIFISEDFEIINIERAEPCEKDPCTLYKSNGNAMYVLEVNEGFSEKSNINVGNSVEIL